MNQPQEVVSAWTRFYWAVMGALIGGSIAAFAFRNAEGPTNQAISRIVNDQTKTDVTRKLLQELLPIALISLNTIRELCDACLLDLQELLRIALISLMGCFLGGSVGWVASFGVRRLSATLLGALLGGFIFLCAAGIAILLVGVIGLLSGDFNRTDSNGYSTDPLRYWGKHADKAALALLLGSVLLGALCGFAKSGHFLKRRARIRA